MWTTLQKLLLVLSTKSSDALSSAIGLIFGRLVLGHFHTDPHRFIHGHSRQNNPNSRSSHSVHSICIDLIYNLLKWYTSVNNCTPGVYNDKLQIESCRVFHGFHSPTTIMRFTLKREIYIIWDVNNACGSGFAG